MASDIKDKLSGRWPRSTWCDISAEELKAVSSLYFKGRFLDAYELLQKVAPLPAWKGGKARAFAGDLAGFLAGYRMSDWLDVTAYRHSPRDESAIMNFARWLKARRGPICAWWFLDEHPLEEAHSNNHRYWWYSLRAAIALQFRDFEQAERFENEARPFCSRPELPVMARCLRLRAQDEWKPALEAAREAYAINPHHTAAQRHIVEILMSQNEDEACLDFFKQALDLTQDAYLVSLKVRFEIERENFAEVLEGLDLYEKWSPLIENNGRRWLSTRRTDAYYHLQEFDKAIAWAEKTGGDYYTSFAERLKVERRRAWVRLPVGFIRQSHNTCGPATLTALANYWGLPADHGNVAESVGYDGTYDFQERRWVEENGFYVREFKVTWEASQLLIDRKIPFSLTTSWPGGAHLQAVIGYDSVWKTLLIRDPGERDIGEFDWTHTDEHYRAVGPRGMAFVPKEQKALLESLDLPEAALYDAVYQISITLDHHARGEALAICKDLETRYPGERMTIQARRLIADYDNNTPDLLACIQQLLKLFPGDERLSLTLLSCLRDVGQRDDRLALLKSLTAKKDCHPLMWKELAIELSDDQRERKSVLHLLFRTHAKMPSHAHTSAKIADARWDQSDISRATDIYRFVACLDDKREAPSRSFFIASRRARRVPEAIDFLRLRFERFGRRSPDPIRTLFYALEQLDRNQEALAELEKAVAMRPKDGHLLCHAAEAYRRYGRKDDATRLLAEAEKESPKSDWKRTSGRLAAQEGDLATALACWREVATLEPLSEEAHREVADLISKIEGRHEAVAYLRTIYERFPFNLAIGRLLLNWVKPDDPPAAIELCRAMLESHPADAWTARELAFRLAGDPNRLEEAIRYAKLGCDLEPGSSYAYSILGTINRRLGKFDEARELLRQAIRLQVDNTGAMEQLVDLCPTQEEKRAELRFIRGELVRQVIFDDALPEFRQQALRAYAPDEVLDYLQEARAARPDLWQAWSTEERQLVSMGRADDAMALALETAKQFPMIAGSWRNLGHAYNQMNRWPEATEAFEKSIEISPDWVSAIVDLSEALRRAGDWARAESVLRSALRHNPNAGVLHGNLAELLRYNGKNDESLSHLKLAIEHSPSYTWAWNKLQDWAESADRIKLCRTLTQKRPGDAEAWRRLVNNLDARSDFDEILAALDKAIALEPQNADTYDLKAWALSQNKRFEEALAVCRPAAWGDLVPLTLRGRAAWLENERDNDQLAIEMMQKVVKDDSGYYWGWSLLSEWMLKAGRVPESVHAAEQMIHLRPDSAVALGYCADARLKQGNRSGAIQDLWRAHALDPDYGFATWLLFDLILDDEEYGKASELLEDARRYSDRGKVLAAEIRLSLCQGDVHDARDRLKTFGASGECSVGTMEDIQKEFQKENAARAFDDVLEKMVSTDKASGPMLDFWIRRAFEHRASDVDQTVIRYLKRDTKIARFGVNSLLNRSGEHARFTPGGAKLLREHADFLRENTHTWGLMGFALNCAQKYAQCARWMSDWRSREGVERWMLINLTESLRNLSRETEVDEVCRRVLVIEPGNYFANLYLAFDAAMAGDHQTAVRYSEMVDENELKSELKLFFGLTKEVIAADDNRYPSIANFREVQGRLLTKYRQIKSPQWFHARAYNLALATIAAKNFAKADAFFFRLRADRRVRPWYQLRVTLKRGLRLNA